MEMQPTRGSGQMRWCGPFIHVDVEAPMLSALPSWASLNGLWLTLTARSAFAAQCSTQWNGSPFAWHLLSRRSFILTQSSVLWHQHILASHFALLLPAHSNSSSRNS